MITLVLTFGLFAAAGAGLLFFRLSRGPIVLGLETQVSQALAAQVRHGFRFHVGSTAFESDNGHPSLVVSQLLMQDESGRAVIKAPQATLSVDPLQMIGGTIVPTRLDVQDVTLKLVILPDGDVALSAGTDESLPFRLSEAFESAAPSPSAGVVAVGPQSEPSSTGSIPSQSADQAERDAFNKLAAALVPLFDEFTGNNDMLAGFDKLGIARGVLFVDDRVHNSVETFRDVHFEFERLAEGVARMSMSAARIGGNHWSVTVNGTRLANGRRGLAVDVDNLTLEDLRLVPGLRKPGFDTDMPMSMAVNATLDKAGTLDTLEGRFHLDAGFFHLDDKDHEPLDIRGVEVPVRFDVANRTLVVEPSTIDTDTASYQFQGTVAQPSGAEPAWSFAATGHGTVGVERPNESPIALERIGANLRLDVGQRHVRIDKLDIAGPQVALGLTGDIRVLADGVHIATKATAGRMPAPVLLRLWPTTVSAAVRSWLLANLQTGMIERGTATTDLDEADLAKMKVDRSVADSHVRVEYAVSGLTLGFMDGVPPLRGLVGTGVVTGDTSKFLVSRGTMDVGSGRQLNLADGSLVVPTTDLKPTPSVITAHIAGPVEAVVDLLSRDSLKTYASLPAEATGAKGQIDGTLTVGIALGAKPRPDDVKIGVNARLSNVSVEKIVGKQNLTDGSIAINLDKASGLHANGTATVAGAPTTIDITKPAGTAPGEANVSMVFDEAARAKAGMTFGRALTGPVTAKMSMPVGGSDKKIAVDLDLSRAGLTNLVPGLSKAVGKPGRATLVAIPRDNGITLDKISCDVGSFSVRGSADLDSNGAFQQAKLSQVRLSPGDDLKVDASQAGNGLKLVVRGANLDARPFLKSLTEPDNGEPGKDLDLDLHTGVLTGQNSQAMTNVDLKMSRRGGQIRKVELKGKLGRAGVEVGSSQQGNVLALTASSGDAGGTLEFLDLYKRLAGGRLDTTIRMMNGHWDGSAVVRDFGLREDPAMKRLTEESLTEGKGAKPPIDASNLSFKKLFVVFSKSGSKIDVKEGSLYSPEMGATVQGSIDFGKDKLALNGTFVPIYGVNNLFSQVPLVGPLLGGGANEGLFGLNYKINGSVANPNLTIDPLSALAPGFLRKIFGAITEAGEDAASGPEKAARPDFDPVAR